MRTFVALVLASLCLLGLGLVGEMVTQVAMARAEGSTSTGLDLAGQTSMATGLIVLAVLWVTSAWRLHVNGQTRAAEAARSERLGRLNDRLRLTNESLRASDKIKDDLLAVTSHELRTPLTAIVGFSEMLMDAADAETRVLAQRIQRGGERLHHTVNGLLDMFKLQSGTLELAPEDVDAASLVRGTVAMLQPLASDQGLDLRVHPADLVLPAHIDRDALDRIVTNLVGNALKFTEEGGVTVTVDATADVVVLSIVDSGIGIAEEDLPSLFLPFTQVSTGASRSHEGTGLGLAIVRQLVDLLGGQIHVQSKVGTGTLVQVEVPRWADVPSVARPTYTTQVSPGLAGGQVLAVGLTSGDVQVLRACVESSGAVCEAETIGKAVRELGRDPYDAVFVGATTARTERKRTRLIRRIPGYAATPVLRVGGESLSAESLQRRGFSHQIVSPLDDVALVKLLESVLMDVEAVLGAAA